MIKLYHYVHCPYCVRVRLALGKLNIPYESVVLPYNDEMTPLNLCGKKMLPILQWENGKAINESLDIIRALDTNNKLSTNELRTANVFKNLEATLDILGKSIHSLAMPYWIYTPEFNSESRTYFQQKKEKTRGPFRDLYYKREELIEKVTTELQSLPFNWDNFFNNTEEINIGDIITTAHLWGLYIVPEFQFPNKIHTYLQRIKKDCSFNYHQDFWK